MFGRKKKTENKATSTSKNCSGATKNSVKSCGSSRTTKNSASRSCKSNSSNTSTK